MTSLQSGVSKMSSQEFESYNQTTISGNEVLAALNTYNNREVALCVSTLKDEADAKATSASFQNYGALLAAPSSNDSAAISTDTDASTFAVTLNTYDTQTGRPSKYVADYQLDSDEEILYNWTTSPTRVKGGQAYINPTGKFYCILVYDTNSEIIGITFRQIS